MLNGVARGSSDGFMPEGLFRELYDTYAGRMRYLAFRITRNEADADDAVQDAFLRVYEKYGTFRHESSLWTWVYRVTQTSALMILKKKRSQKKITLASMSTMACKMEMTRAFTPEHALIQSRLLETLNAGVDLLIPSLRSPMRAYLSEELNQKELCEQLGITLLATKARMHRARRLLRRQLRPCLQPESAGDRLAPPPAPIG